MRHYQSAVYITAEDPGLSWQGLVEMVCIECWSASRPDAASQPGISNAEWRRMCKAMWLEREVAATGHNERNVKQISFKGAAQGIESPRLEPGGGDTIREGILHLSAEDQDKISAAVSLRAQGREKPAECEAYIPQVRHGVLSVTGAQKLEKVAPGLDECFFGRHRDCRDVFRNIDWSHNLAAGGGRSLCPERGQ